MTRSILSSLAQQELKDIEEKSARAAVPPPSPAQVAKLVAMASRTVVDERMALVAVLRAFGC